jgi:hypothetical protein
MARGWAEVPLWVFCSEVGSALDERNVERTWARLRRRAQAEGVRPLNLHAARHTFATQALRAGKSVRWVAAQLGPSDPALTLRVYAHVLRDEETDLAFADFGGGPAPAAPEAVADAPGRPYTAPGTPSRVGRSAKPAETRAPREGLEPPTRGLEIRCSIQLSYWGAAVEIYTRSRGCVQIATRAFGSLADSGGIRGGDVSSTAGRAGASPTAPAPPASPSASASDPRRARSRTRRRAKRSGRESARRAEIATCRPVYSALCQKSRRRGATPGARRRVCASACSAAAAASAASGAAGSGANSTACPIA